TDSNGTVDGPQTCGPIATPPGFPLLTLSTACGSSSASVDGNGFPNATASGAVATANVDGTQVLGQLPLKQITDQIQPLLDKLKPVFPSSDTTGLDPNSLISNLLQAITQPGDLARLHIGAATTSTTSNQPQVVSTATADGVAIDLLPRDVLQLPPV